MNICLQWWFKMDFTNLLKKVEVLAEAAKYDVSCSSSGSYRGNVRGTLGNAAPAGICHSFTQDGRCISLLKILMTNNCIYDCIYCPNRRSNDIKRQNLTPDELCTLVIEFYKRNYIEGLFLSSAIEKTPNDTMNKLTDTVILLRDKYKFNGYIHLKGIPSADTETVTKAAHYADRMSFNIELPTEKSLKLLAPQKNKEAIIIPMKHLAQKYIADPNKHKNLIPAGQTTQMIIGATEDDDSTIIRLTENLYNKFKLKRVYYSAYVPDITNTSSLLPIKPPNLVRENRLYQADWLLRFYGFNAEEIAPNGMNLSEALDPKCAWAIRNLDKFPVEINKASYADLLRIPGIGLKSALKIISARKYTNLNYQDLAKMKIVLKRAVHFITVQGKFFGNKNQRLLECALSLPKEQQQLSIFDNFDINYSVLTGEI